MYVSIDFLDIVFKSATIIIALTNIGFAFYVYKIKTDKDDKDKERDRRINWMKSLVLDHTLKQFYEFCNDIEVELKKLNNIELDDSFRAKVNDNLADKFIDLRQKFIFPFLAVDEKIYDKIIINTDFLQDFLTNEIFESSNDFTDSNIYKELIQDSIADFKVKVLNILFYYRGF